MAYNTIEISNEGGKPVALYRFQYGASEWLYTTNDEDLILGDDVYTATVIADEGVTQGGSDQNDLQITIAANTPVPALFRAGQPTGKIWLTVRRYHLGDAITETPLLWIGTIVNCVQIDDATEQLSGRSIAGTYDRNGLRLAWGRQCPHPLYGIGCNLDKAEFAYPYVIATLTNSGFTVVDYLDPVEGSFSGGFLEWNRLDGSVDRRAIESQVGNDFRIMGSTYGLEVGSEVTIYPGCARDTATCKLFGNLKNYGGFPHMPGKSPFDGSPVF